MEGSVEARFKLSLFRKRKTLRASVEYLRYARCSACQTSSLGALWFRIPARLACAAVLAKYLTCKSLMLLSLTICEVNVLTCCGEGLFERLICHTSVYDFVEADCWLCSVHLELALSLSGGIWVDRGRGQQNVEVQKIRERRSRIKGNSTVQKALA